MNLKKIGKVFTSKFVGTGPKNLPGLGLTKLRNAELHYTYSKLTNNKNLYKNNHLI
jgi:hypothetical protein